MMSFKRSMILAGFLGLVSGLVQAQQPSAPADSGAVIKTETKLVLVDAVVTDKKGAYVRDLTMKDFKVSEDRKEQNIKTFSFEADPNSPTVSQKRYLILFFRQFQHVVRGSGSSPESGRQIHRNQWWPERPDGNR